MNDLVWITGARGFLGRYLVRELGQRGLRVVGFGRAPGADHGCLDFLAGGMTTEGLETALARHGAPRAIYHLAGGATVGGSIADPLGDFHSNVTATALLVDAQRRLCPEAHLVLTSSAAVYGSAHAERIGPGAEVRPFSPYGSHKLAAEEVLRGYAETYGLRATVVRLFSIYGPGIRKQLMFDICTRLRDTGSDIALGGSGLERRDWCHARDTAAALADLVPPEAGRPALYNLGSGEGTTIADTAALLLKSWGGGRQARFSGLSRPGDPFSLVAHPASLPPGFAPAIALEEGIADFVARFRHCGG